MHPNIYFQSTLPVPQNHTHSHYIYSQYPTCPTKPHTLPLYIFSLTYMSHKTTRTPTIYLHSALRVSPNHTHSHYITSQYPTCPTKPHALPLYTFSAHYLSHQTTRTPNIYIQSALPVPTNHTHSHYITSQCPTCPTKPEALPIYTFTVPYLSQLNTRTSTIHLHSSLSVPPNHTHSQYIHSQYPFCPTKPHALKLHSFTVPYLSHQTTRTPTIYLQSTLPVPPNHTHSHYIHSQCPTCPIKPHALPIYTFTVYYVSHLTTLTPTI